MAAQAAASGGMFVAYHFINRSFEQTTAEESALRSLLAQLQAWKGSYDRDLIPTDIRSLRDALFTTLQTDVEADAPPLLLVMDGMDEANQIVENFIPPELAANIHILVSYRAEEQEWPAGLNSWKRCERYEWFSRYELKALEFAGIKTWLQHVLATNTVVPIDETKIVEQLERSTDGVPLFLSFVLENMADAFEANGCVEDLLGKLETLPEPFTQYVAERLDELHEIGRGNGQAWSEGVRRFFALMTVTRGPISIYELEEILGRSINFHALDHRIERWFTRQLSTRASAGNEQLAFMHPRLAPIFASVLGNLSDEMQVQLID